MRWRRGVAAGRLAAGGRGGGGTRRRRDAAAETGMRPQGSTGYSTRNTLDSVDKYGWLASLPRNRRRSFCPR
jgi:hypothetical protein